MPRVRLLSADPAQLARFDRSKNSLHLCVDTNSSLVQYYLVPPRNNVPASPGQLSKEYKLMKISIHTISKINVTTIAAAIEAIAAEHDTIASGVIGPSFSTSGPGSGWSKQHDCHDYARRALSADYGAVSYIDSSDGREATMNDDEELEWSDESVVEIELPSVEEALEDPAAAKIIIDQAADYGADDDEIEELKNKIAEPYRLSDGSVIEYAATLEEAAGLAEDWYDYLLSDGRIEELPMPNLEAKNLNELCSSIQSWENEIAEAMGKKSFAGHGSYYVTAAAAAGMNLSITIRD